MQWYFGETKTLFESWEFSDNPLWADYQVLGPSFAAISVFLGLDDVLPIIIGARGCAVHNRFTKIAWGGDFSLSPKPLPFIEVSRTDVVNADYDVTEPQLEAIKNLLHEIKPNLLVLLSNDDILLTCASVEKIKSKLNYFTGIQTEFLEVSPLSGRNQWIGYDKALALLYQPFLKEKYDKNNGINLVGWKWPSRERKHDIGACLNLLSQVNVQVNHVIPGGSNLDDIRDSLSSQANLLWCPSYIGETLEMLEREMNLPIAGFTPPYGITGTSIWLEELAAVLHDREDILENGNKLKELTNAEAEVIREKLKGTRGFVSGGPGRLPGLLSIMADLGIDIEAAALYWPHPNKKVQKPLQRVTEMFPKPINHFLVAPSLYDLEEIAIKERIDFWMGGYQEQHVCKQHGIPFIPTTVYSKSHQCFEGVITVGNKIEKALNGYDFVANVFQSNEEKL